MKGAMLTFRAYELGRSAVLPAVTRSVPDARLRDRFAAR
jgi:hypothetical protein